MRLAGCSQPIDDPVGSRWSFRRASSADGDFEALKWNCATTRYAYVFDGVPIPVSDPNSQPSLLFLRVLFYWKVFFHPFLLAFGIVRHIGVAHGRQFTGGVFAGVSMRIRAIGDDRGVLIRQQLRSEFLDFVGRNVQGSGNMAFAVTFRRQCLDDRD